MHPFDPRQLRQGSPLSFVDLKADLEGQSGDLGFIRRTLPDGESIGAEPGPLQAQLAIERGVLTAPGRVGWESPQLRGELHGLFAGSAARFALEVQGPAGGDAPAHALASVALSGLTLSAHRSGNALAQAESARLELSSEQLDLASPLAWSSLRAAVTGARANELARFQPLLPQAFPLRLLGGNAQAHGTVEATPDKATAELFFAANDASLAGDGAGARWSASGAVRVRGHDLAGWQFDLSSSHVALQRERRSAARGPGWWGRFDAPRAEVQGRAGSAAFTLRGSCRDASPLLPLLESQGVPGLVAGLFKMPALTFDTNLLVGPGRFALTDLKAQGGSTSLLADYDVDREQKRGEVFIKLGHTAFGLDLDGGRARAVLVDATSWYADRLRSRHAARLHPAKPAPVALEQRRGHAP